MRLLSFDSHNKLNINQYRDDEVPYAILSHTWGDDEEEVTFRDVIESSGRGRVGYRKIEFCQKRLENRSDNLAHFWIDTCCIHKADAGELSRSLTSMFRWYSNAAICYVYISDVSMPGHQPSPPSHEEWKAAFLKSQWFTRGWTLQELIAPRAVEFYSAEGTFLGDRISLENLIQDITGLPIDVLRSGSTALTKYSDDEKFRWAESRQTKEPEDRVYSLLGIFGVSMAIIYGEGRELALGRLKGAIRELRLSTASIGSNFELDEKEIEAIFDGARRDSTASLSLEQRNEFKQARSEQVKRATYNLQQTQQDKKSMMNLARLKQFLLSMDSLARLMPLTNCDAYTSYIWGAMKFMILVSIHYSRTLDVFNKCSDIQSTFRVTRPAS
jgi:hypothetical protein